MVKKVKYFKYNTFGPVTLYTGRMGSGLTLGAVIQIVKASSSRNPPTIASNTTLRYLDYKQLAVEDIESYTESPHLFLFDSPYGKLSASRHASRESTLWCYLFSMLRKSSSRAILTSSMGLQVFDRRIRSLVTDIMFVRSLFSRHQKLQLTHYKLLPRSVWTTIDGKKVRERVLKWVPVAVCELKRTGRYWKYYNTLELPGKEIVQ